MAKRNGYLEYDIEGVVKRKLLYVDVLEQPLTLSGATSQSRLTKSFYPRSYAPGDISVSGRCDSQEELQTLGAFIRDHQMALINVPNTTIFNHIDTTTPGFRLLLKLVISGESLGVRGFIGRFTVTKKGVFEPAPQFNFNFTVVFDPQASDISISRAITKYKNDPNKALIVKGDVAPEGENANGGPLPSDDPWYMPEG